MKNENNSLLLVTSNAHKAEEFEALLNSTSIKRHILTLKDIGFDEEIEENGNSFSENAWIKVNALRDIWKGDILADDSGFEVQALGGSPGVISARYAGVHGDHAANMAKVIKEMEGALNRTACFKTVLAGHWRGQSFEFQGVIQGSVLRHPQGWGGFGYDPIFVPKNNSRSFAEMSLEEKNLLSHRGVAFDKWISWIRKSGM